MKSLLVLFVKKVFFLFTVKFIQMFVYIKPNFLTMNFFVVFHKSINIKKKCQTFSSIPKLGHLKYFICT